MSSKKRGFSPALRRQGEKGEKKRAHSSSCEVRWESPTQRGNMVVERVYPESTIRISPLYQHADV